MREQYPNNVVETDHGWLKARLRPMRGVTTIRSLRVIALVMPSCRTCAAATTKLAVDTPARDRVPVAFDELALRV